MTSTRVHSHERTLSRGRSILRFLLDQRSRARIASVYLPLSPEEACDHVDKEALVRGAGLPAWRGYALEFIPAQGGCVVAIVPPQNRRTIPHELTARLGSVFGRPAASGALIGAEREG